MANPVDFGTSGWNVKMDNGILEGNINVIPTLHRFNTKRVLVKPLSSTPHPLRVPC